MNRKNLFQNIGRVKITQNALNILSKADVIYISQETIDKLKENITSINGLEDLKNKYFPKEEFKRKLEKLKYYNTKEINQILNASTINIVKVDELLDKPFKRQELIDKLKKYKIPDILIDLILNHSENINNYTGPPIEYNRNRELHINYRLIYQWLALESLLKPTFIQCCMLCKVNMSNIPEYYQNPQGLEEFEFTLKGALRCEMSQKGTAETSPCIAIRRLAFGTNKGIYNSNFGSEDDYKKNRDKFSDNLETLGIPEDETKKEHYRKWKGVVLPKVFNEKENMKNFFNTCPIKCWEEEEKCPLFTSIDSSHKGWWCLLQFKDYDICITPKHILELFNFYHWYQYNAKKFVNKKNLISELQSNGIKEELLDVDGLIKKMEKNKFGLTTETLDEASKYFPINNSEASVEDLLKIWNFKQSPKQKINKVNPEYKDSLSNILNVFFNTTESRILNYSNHRTNCFPLKSLRQPCETKNLLKYKDIKLVFKIIPELTGTPSYFLQSQSLGVSELTGRIEEGQKKIVSEEFIYLDEKDNFKKKIKKGIMVSSIKGMFRQASACLLEAIKENAEKSNDFQPICEFDFPSKEEKNCSCPVCKLYGASRENENKSKALVLIRCEGSEIIEGEEQEEIKYPFAYSQLMDEVKFIEYDLPNCIRQFLNENHLLNKKFEKQKLNEKLNEKLNNNDKEIIWEYVEQAAQDCLIVEPIKICTRQITQEVLNKLNKDTSCKLTPLLNQWFTEESLTKKLNEELQIPVDQITLIMENTKEKRQQLSFYFPEYNEFNIALVCLTADMISSGQFRLGRLTTRGYGLLRLEPNKEEIEGRVLNEDGSGYKLEKPIPIPEDCKSGYKLAKHITGKNPFSIISEELRKAK